MTWTIRVCAIGCLWAICNGAVGQKLPESMPEMLEAAFDVPEQWRDRYGDHKSLRTLDDGSSVESVAQWERRRAEILQRWHAAMGKWPELDTSPEVEVLERRIEPDHERSRIRFDWAPGQTTTGYLLLPDGDGPHPAVVTVYYEPETAIGQGREYRDFGLQLLRRGFVVLSLGTTEATEAKTYSIYHPSLERAEVEPLSMLAYAAATAWHVLADRPEVDPERIGIVGHSFGGKWAMFGACLYDKFRCGVWSDPGVMFDDMRGNINYWEPWYLGYHRPPWRKRGLITEGNPAYGAYPKLRQAGHDLHELQALMVPRPFLVSGGSEDPVSRWSALNHIRDIYQLYGISRGVAMTNRPEHAPNEDSNAVIYAFFEHFLKSE